MGRATAVLLGAIGHGLIALFGAILHTAGVVALIKAGVDANACLSLCVGLPSLGAAVWAYRATDGSALLRLALALLAFVVTLFAALVNGLVYTAPLGWAFWLIVGACYGARRSAR